MMVEQPITSGTLERTMPVQMTRRKDGWELYRIPLSATPDHSQAPLYRILTVGLADSLTKERKFQMHALLSFWRFGHGSLAGDYNRDVSEWQGSFGLGVWPDRPSPNSWTQETFLEAAAARIEKREPVLMSYPLIHLGAEAPVLRRALNVFAGQGALVQLFGPESFDAITKRTSKKILPTIASSAYRNERFYLPLLEVSTIAGASTERLEYWLEGIHVYVRESSEDNCTFILSRLPLATIFESVAAKASLTLNWQFDGVAASKA